MFKPQFTITNTILNSIAQIEAARQIINNAPLVPAWERHFREQAEDRTIHFSTKIEGNQLDFDEAKKASEGKKVVTFRRRDVIEIINYRQTIEFINSLKKLDLSKELLFQIHKLIMAKILPEEELGKFRQSGEALIDSKTYDLITEFIEPEYVEGEVDNFFEWLNKESKNIHPVIKAAIISYEITRIHPFTDGNGRTARVLATYSLYADGYDIKKFFSLEEYYDQNLEAYYKAIESVEENDDDMTKWIEFFAGGLAVEFCRVKEKVLGMSHDVRLKKNIGQIALNDRQIKIIDFIEEYKAIRNQDWQEMFPDISDDTILRDMKDLMEKGIIKKEGKTKAAKYIIK